MNRTSRAVLTGIAAVALLALVAVASLAIGSRSIEPEVVWQALTGADAQSNDAKVVLFQRVPRMVIGMLAGAALGVAGTLMQGLTRNPLADPGLLGVNAGASVAVLVGVLAFGITHPGGFTVFALVGAALAAAVVMAIGSRGGGGEAGPVKLALTGAAVTAGLTSLTMYLLNTEQTALDAFRFWSVGSLTGRDIESVVWVAPLIGIALVGSLFIGGGLNLLAMGEASARSLGHSVRTTQITTAVLIVVLCGSATAIAGPIVFAGLVVPHLLRALVGVDYRTIVAISIPAGAALLVAADVVGRMLAPSEVEAGLVVAFIGAPVLVGLVLKRRMVKL
ncbi:FecCD family ABC transporter permease [Agrococcus casei]|uniref:ABC-type Fe3+-siderophore transport system, permease component n=3 Tax=Agrococcus TaxID=46352 RepID=A0A1R4G0X4_9MICO|nr:iron chelate uptake ABC transporter family permease subunit [Agrococcus casei]SJM61829.1 ABC-type Fe3+-siderophore transport system, permease component [Agrococcus casei LMG 22410]